MLFVKEEGHGKVTDLFLGVFVRRNKVDSFKMSEIDIPAENVYVEKLHNRQRYVLQLYPGVIYLADIFLLVISAQVTIYISESVNTIQHIAILAYL